MMMLPPLRWIASPNFSRRASGAVNLVVVHDTEGGYDGAIRWFANRHSEVSAHLVLREDGGEATQMVAYADKAWHAVQYNSRSIGLEMAGFAKSGYGENEWAIAARIVAVLLHQKQIKCQWAQCGRGSGFCRHYDLGKAGGGHTDPTTDNKVWGKFVERVGHEYSRTDLPATYGR